MPDLLATELAVEQRQVDLCYDLLDRLRRRAESSLQESIDLQTSTPQSVFEREVFASYSRKRLQAVSSSEHQLVFGRLDLDGERHPAYVGRIGLAGEDQERVLIDWRAPVGSAFYRATAREPLGVVRRRTLVTKGRRVVDLNDDVLEPDKAGDLGVVHGEGALLTSLLRERGEFMQDIVATIQAEQDEVIRTDPRASILLRGGPGTGKSVVALHRTAYLMYERAAELERRGVLVVGPGRRFSRYISRVLPSLGETSVNIRSLFDLTHPISASGRERLELARIKGDRAMAGTLKSFLIATYPAPEAEVRASVGGRPVKLDRAELSALRRQVLSSRSSGFNLSAGKLWLAMARRLLQQGGRRGPGKPELNAFARALQDRGELEELIEQMLPLRTGEEVWRSMGGSAAALRPLLLRWLTETEVKELLEDLRSEQPRVGDLPLIDELNWLLGPADPAPATEEEVPGYEEVTTAQDRLDLARRRTVSATKLTGYGHIVVDEAQDVTPMQWRMLQRRGEDATWTIVGDPAQATLASSSEMESAAGRLIGDARLRSFRLAVNYRTPRRIMEYAQRASGLPLGDLRSIRSGGDPVFFRFADQPEPALRQAATWLMSHGGSGCIIAASLLDLPAVEELDLGTEVLWALDAKGLEFDNVVLYRPEAVDTSDPADASLVLIGATRATKRLAVVTGRTFP